VPPPPPCHKASASHRIEVDAGRHRHADLVEHLPSENQTVIGEGRDIAIEIKGTVGRHDFAETYAGQRLEQQLAVGVVTSDVARKLVVRIECPQCRRLRDCGRCDVEVLRQSLNRPHQGLGHDHPADAPAGHRKILRERVDDDRRIREGESRLRAMRIGETVVDLIGDEPQAARFAGACNRRQPLRLEHGSGRVGGARDQHARKLGDLGGQPIDRFRRRHPARSGSGLDRQRPIAKGAQDMAVARVAWLWQRDRVTCVEEGEKGKYETC